MNGQGLGKFTAQGLLFRDNIMDQGSGLMTLRQSAGLGAQSRGPGIIVQWVKAQGSGLSSSLFSIFDLFRICVCFAFLSVSLGHLRSGNVGMER